MAKEKEGKGTNVQQEGNQTGTQAMQTTQQAGGQQPGLERRGASFPGLFGGSPFTLMRRLSEEMDRLFEDFGFGRGWLAPTFGQEFFQRGLSDFGGAVWSPQVEVFERDGRLVVRADLPGLTKDDVKVEVTGEAIVLQGERRKEHEEKGEGFYRSERSYGSFYRAIPLPEGAGADQAEATFRNGVLEVTMPAPQRAEQNRRQIEIRDADASQQPKARAQSAGAGR